MEKTGEQIFSVTELTKLMKGELEEQFANIWVEGEISNLARPRSGHVYFTLKDENAQIRGVIFKFAGRRLKIVPENGMKVLLRGSLSVYEARGEYQILVNDAEAQGAGALQAAFEQLKVRLEREGLFDDAHKTPLPLLPKKIAVVTSATGAAIRDILQVIHRRFANVHVFIAPVLVQGADAPRDIVRAIEMCNQLPDLDVLIVGRGGGSLEDLWAFNEEIVARSIFASKIPVISAVGHEIDFTIADFAADLRAPTPSAAAELVVQNKENLVRTVHVLRTRLNTAQLNELTRLKSSVRHYRQRLQDPRKSIRERQQRTDDVQQRLLLAWRSLLERKRARCSTAVGKLETLSPLALLARGYAACRHAEHLGPVRALQDVQIHDELLLRVSDGELRCAVSQKYPLPRAESSWGGQEA
ncbi:exodeoxyribonuclease VII large subunit [candidate division KSB3 bacterium]|uniref:Exodeoxyribonuclease 7 large subunit n=1 Tax=candidate division KSB3 bacterium TaxID=2044937 RepID=A0A2G6E3B4_9BACT|nr:MAG: exodeoxyribonuclease VII large subunit [candidate division KSB3 bacterium]PIE29308.1 MAG: exodeoxyribonuclease VII large subunit [candidate division KSB3 bacterium]